MEFGPAARQAHVRRRAVVDEKSAAGARIIGEHSHAAILELLWGGIIGKDRHAPCSGAISEGDDPGHIHVFNVSGKVLDSPRVVGNSGAREGKRRGRAHVDREGAGSRLIDNAIENGSGRQGNIGHVGDNKSSRIRWTVRHGMGDPVGPCVPVATGWTKPPGRAPGVAPRRAQS